MTDLHAALTTALKAGGWVRGVASRYGKFNDAYWEQSAYALHSDLPPGTALITPQERAVVEAIGRLGDSYGIVKSEDGYFVSKDGGRYYAAGHTTLHAAVDALLEGAK